MDTFLAPYLLSSQGDRVAMAHSVEGRVPFLDHRVIELAARFPSNWKIRGLDEKHILKRMAARYLPPAIARRPKQPYRAPVAEPFSALSRHAYLHALLDESSLRASGWFDPPKVRLLLRRLEEGRAFGEVQGMALVGILTTELLHRRFVQGFPGDVEPREPDRVVRQAL
jgi:asparagine synthase (glutamine-hydrolysing)